MEETRYTYCRVCEPGCGIKATVIDGRLISVMGDEQHPLSKGHICARGMATLDIHNDPDRLKTTVKRVNGRWQEIKKASAIAEIGHQLKEIRERHGDDAVAVYIGNPTAFDFSLMMYWAVAVKTMNTRNFYGAGSQDCNNKNVAASRVFGSSMLHPVPDINKIDFLMIIGSNPAVSYGSWIVWARPVEALKAIENRGGRVILIDPRRTETAKVVGEHIFIRPDTDVYLLLAMLQVIISEGLYDKKEVEAHTKGFEELSKLAEGYPPERVAVVTGIEASEIRALGRDFANAMNAGIHASLGINLGSFGTLGYWLVQCLNAITGRFDRRGSMLFPEGILKIAKPYKPPKEALLSRIGGYEPVLGALPAGILADEILTPGKGQIKALIVVSGNPLLTVPNPERLEEAIKQLDLVVSLDLFVNETGEISHYVLPAKDFYERWDFTLTSSFLGPVRSANYTDKVLDAEGERTETWIDLHRILMAAGYQLGKEKVLSLVFNALDRLPGILNPPGLLNTLPRLLLKAILLKSEVSWKELKKSRQAVLLKDHKTGDFFAKRLLTRDKKVDLAPADFIREAQELEEFFDKEKEYTGLKLIGQRQRRTHNSWFHNVESFVQKEETNRVSIHPQDASALRIVDGELVEVESESGRITLPTKVTDELMPGVVSIPHGWGHGKPSGLTTAKKYPGVNVNELMASGPESLERLAGMSKLTGIRVTVRKTS